MHPRVGHKCVYTNIFYHRFDFLQSCEGNLVFPTLPQAHVWTGDKIHRLAGQGCLYICPTYDCLIARVRHCYTIRNFAKYTCLFAIILTEIIIGFLCEG